MQGLPKKTWRLFSIDSVKRHQPTPRVSRGSGLGLSLSRQLAAMIGATLEVTSQPGEGSTFSLRFPVSANAPHKD